MMKLLKRKEKDTVDADTQKEIVEVKGRLDTVEKRVRLLEQTVKVYKREA